VQDRLRARVTALEVERGDLLRTLGPVASAAGRQSGGPRRGDNEVETACTPPPEIAAQAGPPDLKALKDIDTLLTHTQLSTMTSRLAPVLRHLTEGGRQAPGTPATAAAAQDALSPLKVSINTDKVRPPRSHTAARQPAPWGNRDVVPAHRSPSRPAVEM
jgi:hypothetical protein